MVVELEAGYDIVKLGDDIVGVKLVEAEAVWLIPPKLDIEIVEDIYPVPVGPTKVEEFEIW